MGLVFLLFLAATATSPDGRRVYSTNSAKNVLEITDPRAAKVLRSVSVGPSPTGLAVSPDGRRVFVCVGGKSEIDVIDTALLMKVKTIPVGNAPQNIYVTPDNTRMIALSDRRLSIVNIRTESVEFEIPLSGAPRELTIEANDKTLVIGRLMVKETNPDRIEFVDYAKRRVVKK